MKIGFLKNGSIVTASTRIRVDYVLPYMKDAIASNNPSDLKDCDVIIFQKRYKEEDCRWARFFKKCNKKVIFDLTDPVWDKDYPAVYFPITHDKEEYFNMMIQLSDCITFPTFKLESMFLETFGKYNTKVVLDRIDLSLHQYPKVHEDKKQYIILWHGTKFSISHIDLVRNDLEKLAKEVNFKLVIIYEKGGEQLKPFKNFEVEYKIWDINTINQEILNADITINPHPENSYKSNNKCVKSWALGVPCITNNTEFKVTNFYDECLALLNNKKIRKKITDIDRSFVESYYDSEISAREIEELCNEIKTKI